MKQGLIPFKANFVIEYNISLEEFLAVNDKQSIKEKLSKVADELGNIDVSKLIQYYHLGSKIYHENKKFSFNYHKPSDVSPSNILLYNEVFEISFKLTSSIVEVIQIVDDKITFVDYENSVHTVVLSDNMKLIKV